MARGRSPSESIAGHRTYAVGVETVDELAAAVSAIEQAAIQSSCETRRLVGQQAVAFTAAALPLCRRV